MKYLIGLIALCAFVSCSDSNSSAPLTLQEARELEEVIFFGGGADVGNPLDGGLGYSKEKQEALRSLIDRSFEQRETYDSGQVKSEGHALNDGTKVWRWKTWHENGQLESEGHYKAGAREGRWRFYDEHGLDRYRGNYKAGERVGQWLSYTPGEYFDGKAWYTPQMGFGFNDGRLADWTVETETTENGATVTSKGMVDSDTGVRLSEWISQYESGEMYAHGHYREGERSGVWTWWNKDGSVMKTEQFD